MNKVAPIILSLILTIAVGLGACTPASPPVSQRAIERPPASPSNLTAQAVSHDAVKLQWIDNSGNEDGFRIYRGNKLIETVRSNVTTYQDVGLKPATTYNYMVKAYNAAGESPPWSASVRTRNPPITVRLDKIGVYDNREDWTRGTDGEVYLYIVISDRKRTTEQVRFPQQEGQHFKLAKNETVDIGAIIFSVDEVGDFLMVSVIGYEDDGGGFEPLVYKALGAAGLAYITGGSGSFLEMFEYSLGGLIGTLLGAEDDWLGSYERTWNQANNWGVGKYIDIPLEDERGIQCLRLWFTIKSPVSVK